MDVVKIALGCGYPNVVSVDTLKDLDIALIDAKNRDDEYSGALKSPVR